MKTVEKILIFGGVALGLLILSQPVYGMATETNFLIYLQPLFEGFETFSPTPYWDVSRWSWGYGTEVPGSVRDRSVKPSGTITEDQALSDSLAHINNDLAYLAPKITAQLNPRQMAALLDFSYNEGPGNAAKLLTNINSGDNDSLGVEWNEYIYVKDSNGNYIVSEDLVNRRDAEWQLWNS